MELFGVTLELDTLGAIVGLFSTITTFIWGIIQYKGKKKAQDLINDAKKLSNIDLLNKGYNGLYDDINVIKLFESKLLKLYVGYCEENLEGFTKYIKTKKDEYSLNSGT